jgi:hypothetical protein
METIWTMQDVKLVELSWMNEQTNKGDIRKK